MSIYYQDEQVTLYHGDCMEVLAGMDDKSVSAVITDPPYTERTHSKARSNLASGVVDGIEFNAFTDDMLYLALQESGRVSESWVIATLDYRHAFAVEATPPRGLKCQRIGVWVKPSTTPQLSGDRPAQGWEAIAYLHRADSRSKWHGGGKAGNYVMNTPREGRHPTEKPLPLAQDFIRRFTDPGDTVLDPFAGSGTTLRAAVDEGRKAVGVELEERYCEIIAKRLSQGAFDFAALAQEAK